MQRQPTQVSRSLRHSAAIAVAWRSSAPTPARRPQGTSRKSPTRRSARACFLCRYARPCPAGRRAPSSSRAGVSPALAETPACQRSSGASARFACHRCSDSSDGAVSRGSSRPPETAGFGEDQQRAALARFRQGPTVVSERTGLELRRVQGTVVWVCEHADAGRRSACEVVVAAGQEFLPFGASELSSGDSALSCGAVGRRSGRRLRLGHLGGVQAGGRGRQGLGHQLVEPGRVDVAGERDRALLVPGPHAKLGSHDEPPAPARARGIDRAPPRPRRRQLAARAADRPRTQARRRARADPPRKRGAPTRLPHPMRTAAPLKTSYAGLRAASKQPGQRHPTVRAKRRPTAPLKPDALDPRSVIRRAHGSSDATPSAPLGHEAVGDQGETWPGSRRFADEPVQTHRRRTCSFGARAPPRRSLDRPDASEILSGGSAMPFRASSIAVSARGIL
jgi:hypothetical protein